MHYNTIRPQYLLNTPAEVNNISESPDTCNDNICGCDPGKYNELLNNNSETNTTIDKMVSQNTHTIVITSEQDPPHESVSHDNVSITFQEILQSIRKERSTNMEDFHEIHKSIIEQSRANTDDNEDEEYDEENNWYIDDAYKRKLKRIQEMKKRRTKH
jgi:hypothetical protein